MVNNYILLAAGEGTRLHPYTKLISKCSINIGNKETVLQRAIRVIKELDSNSNIYIVLGYKAQSINVMDSNIVINPFFKVTNSVASLWFAQKHISGDTTTIINGDIVFEKNILKEIIECKKTPFVCVDSSIKIDGDYNVQVNNDKVIVMGKELKTYFAEYAGITKLDNKSYTILKKEINYYIYNGFYNEWYETILVQLILRDNLFLNYLDIADMQWTEIDSTDDILKAKQIQEQEHKK